MQNYRNCRMVQVRFELGSTFAGLDVIKAHRCLGRSEATGCQEQRKHVVDGGKDQL